MLLKRVAKQDSPIRLLSFQSRPRRPSSDYFLNLIQHRWNIFLLLAAQCRPYGDLDRLVHRRLWGRPALQSRFLGCVRAQGLYGVNHRDWCHLRYFSSDLDGGVQWD